MARTGGEDTCIFIVTSWPDIITLSFLGIPHLILLKNSNHNGRNAQPFARLDQLGSWNS